MSAHQTLPEPDWMQDGKIINDAIHGHIELSKPIVHVIDTPQFQRLRDLKQLGVTYFVFPGASHCRFEHSIGVSFLASQLMGHLRTQKELEVSDEEVHLVSLAGLCHDLGHGPFSHAFEGWLERAGKAHFKHETMSLRMLDYLVDDNGLNYDTDDLTFVKDLIVGKPSKAWEGRQWMFDIVSNQRNSVDVDKFDYLARDCYNLGIKSSYDFSRLMQYNRVINNQICYNSKEVYNVYEMFHTRYSLFKQVYLHRVGKAIEHMIGDALLAADPVLKIADRLDSPEEYMGLTDSILIEIEQSKSPELSEARGIIKRLRKRQLYKMADEIILPATDVTITASDVIGCQDMSDPNTRLTENDIIIDKFVCNYAMKDKNPVDNVSFFSSKATEGPAFKLPKKAVSLLIPDTFSEHYVRVYCKDPKLVAAAHAAFRTFVTKGGHGTPTTPPHELALSRGYGTPKRLDYAAGPPDQ